MSKVVKIPECANPFVVYVNGKKYLYPAGQECEVPDEVAVVIEAHNKKHAEAVAPVEAPFGSDGGYGYVEEKTIVEGSLSGAEGTAATAWFKQGRINLEAGKNYVLKLDSGIHEVVCVAQDTCLYFGNSSLYGFGEDTGESFFVFEMEDDGAYLSVILDANGGGSFSLIGRTIHTIDPKFIPSAVLPVVDLSEDAFATIMGNPNTVFQLPTDDAVALDVAASNHTPIMLNLHIGGVPFASLHCAYISEGGVTFTAIIPMTSYANGKVDATTLLIITLNQKNDGWECVSAMPTITV